MATKLPHAADESDEGLQRTPELESSVVTTAAAVSQVDSNSRCHHTSTSSSSNRASVTQATSKTMTTTTAKTLKRLKLQQLLLLLLLLWRRARPPHQRTSVKWQKRHRRKRLLLTESKENKNTCCLSLHLRITDTVAPIYYYSFWIMHVYLCGASSRKEEGPSRSLLGTSPTPPIPGKLKYPMDTSSFRQILLNTLINTAEI